ncbi:uncharacterized protein LOC144006154 [Festucalex cinctus]
MGLLREYIWLWLVLGIIFACLLIATIFAFINRCISRNEKHRFLQHRNDSKDKESKYQQRNQITPPLPPRIQFLLAEAQSYENIADVPNQRQNTMSHDLHDHEHNMEDLPKHMQILDQQPDFHQNLDNLQNLTNLLNHDQTLTHPYIQDHYLRNLHNQDLTLPNFHNQDQNLTDFHNYEQIRDEVSDYVEVEDQDDEEAFPLVPSYEEVLDPADDIAEDYDDIGDENQDEKDYDDVG